jgi:hypothetical protein
MSGIKGFSDHSDERHVLRAGAEHFGGHEALCQSRRMRVEALRGLRAKDVGFAEKQNGAGRMVAGSNAIDQDHRFQSRDTVRQVEGVPRSAISTPSPNVYCDSRR